jgi:fructose-specific phosphotransferase system IIC component
VSAQPPPPPPQGYLPVVYRDPHDYFRVGQDDQPGYLHDPGRDNPQAITGFSFGVSGLGLLVLSGGISFLISLPCSIVAIVVGRRGMRAVDTGVATKHRRYAKAGFVMGIVTCSLAAFMGVSLILAAIFPDSFDNSDSEFTALPLVSAFVRLVRFVTGT